MLLSKLFEELPNEFEREISGLCIDSRKAKSGDLFFCLKGLEADGHRFADKACQAGACAVVHSDDLDEAAGVAYIKVEDVNAELNRICDLFFDQPSKKMTVFGVTGTNGKTTTTSIIRDIYGKKKPCGYMGTIAVEYGDVSRVPNLTTPDALEIHESLREMVDYGMEAVAMEVSSHGLAMGRTDTVDFDIAVFTNLTYDHLDYHKTMEAYFDAKRLLFSHMKPSGKAVLNADEGSFAELARSCSCPYVTYGVQAEADYRAEDVSLRADGTDFTLVCGGRKYSVKTNLVALYNIYNLLGAIAAMHQSGMEIEDMLPYMAHISQIDGRMEMIEAGQNFHLIVDYAHTPDGFEKVFQYAREIASGDIYTVFGCAGKRDRVKRKVLGEIAGKYCRKVFVTEEDPRNERPCDIAAAIIEGSGADKSVFIEDRYKAIEAAVKTAKEGDCLLILGKGDEPYMYYEEGRRPWMGDDEAARKAVEFLMRES
ncbi:UDP-N-acetylmuramoyl-L-alanyl-D-glutamate--2,6-diaminopimelate ligase [Ihubacter sp. rT4E-8]|uniref:UDP-N-acetylmuramoyl-L-alanyl-D-glutamate--2, 6-diaminopimelate ligase n=1 Tax=unclassified Ihubacter TaxID=2633299 RepID=UPI00137ABDD6